MELTSKTNATNGISKSFENFDTETSAEIPSRLSSAIFFLLCFIPIISTVAYGAVDNWALGFLTIFSGAIAVLWLFDSFIGKEFQFSKSLLQIPIIGLILIGLIQLLPLRSLNLPKGLISVPTVQTLSLDAYSTRFAIILLIVYLVFFAAALVFINTRKRMRKIVFISIIFASVIAFFGILQFLANLEAIYGLRPSLQARPFGSFVNQHHFAAFMVMMLGLTIALLFGKAVKSDKNLLLIIAAVIMGIALILTSSRGAFLSLLGVLGFIIAANWRNKKNDAEENGGFLSGKYVYLGGSALLILAIFGAVLLLGGDESFLRSTGLQNRSDDSSGGRTHFWSVALKIFLDYPILGAGLNAFGAVFPRYDSWNGSFRVEQAHNDYLQMLADGGILGFICITAFIFLLFKKSLQIIGKTSDKFRRNAVVGALAGCFGILIHSFFDFPLRTPSNMFFFLILAVIATSSVKFSKNSA